jgi:hypothetical protein
MIDAERLDNIIKNMMKKLLNQLLLNLQNSLLDLQRNGRRTFF